jgi:hypothetical protein
LFLYLPALLFWHPHRCLRSSALCVMSTFPGTSTQVGASEGA